tara:strand:- start:14219 stop:14404 length:186 start_codon:yes stop_codon:yes gene_type:complete
MHAIEMKAGDLAAEMRALPGSTAITVLLDGKAVPVASVMLDGAKLLLSSPAKKAPAKKAKK